MIFSNIIGRYLPGKGIHIYMQAIAELNCNNCSFEIIGKQESTEVAYLQKLQEIQSTKLIQKDFIDDISLYYDKIDVVVHTATKPDALPTVLIEGLAKGKILLAADVAGGVREIVDVDYGNLIIPPGNIEALKTAILTIAAYDAQKIEEIRQRNIACARERFSLVNQVHLVEEIYKDLHTL